VLAQQGSGVNSRWAALMLLDSSESFSLNHSMAISRRQQTICAHNMSSYRVDCKPFALS
jgi:hypothetical protein